MTARGELADHYGPVDSVTSFADGTSAARLAELIARHSHCFPNGYQFDVWPNGQIDMRPLFRSEQRDTGGNEQPGF